MIFRITHGSYWSHTYRPEPVVGVAQDNRRFINAVFWILRTGAPWRDLPPDYEGWKNTHRRFCRWRDKGVWEGLLEQLVDEPDYEWLMLDASHIKVHLHAAGCNRLCEKHGIVSRCRTDLMFGNLG